MNPTPEYQRLYKPRRTIDLLLGLALMLACIGGGTWVLAKVLDLGRPSTLTVAREVVWVDGVPMLRTCYLTDSHAACELR